MTIHALTINKPKVLGLDDDEDVAKIMTEKMAIHGIQFEMHTVQAEFIKALQIKPDIVFIDWTIPGAEMNGNQLAETVIGINKKCLVIMVTGRESFRDLHRFVYKIGGFAWVVKGYNDDYIDELTGTIESAITEMEKRIEWEQAREERRIKIESRSKVKAQRQEILNGIDHGEDS